MIFNIDIEKVQKLKKTIIEKHEIKYQIMRQNLQCKNNIEIQGYANETFYLVII